MDKTFSVVLVLLVVLDSFGQSVTSPPPAEVVFVPHPSGYYLTKHPTLPMLYLGCYYAPESKNLVTFQLASDGTINTNSLRAFNYFSENPTNELWRYTVQHPLVLAEERILYLACVPSSGQFFAHTNHQEIAAVSLDETGQPGKILKAIRTTHGEKEIRAWQFDPLARRLYMSYHTYFGWIPIGKDSLPESDKLNLVGAVQTCWQWVFVSEWQRFYARQTDGGLIVFKLSANGLATELSQSFYGPYRGANNLGLNRAFGKVYFLDTMGARLAMYQFTKDGRFTGVPRFFPLPDVGAVRYDFKSNYLYGWNDKAVLKRYQFDEKGVPKEPPQIFALNCGAIRDMVIDDAGGKIYVACTEMPPPPK